MKEWIDDYRLTITETDLKARAKYSIPWLVAIRYRKSKGAFVFCGGTILDSKTILTAAHCFDPPRDEFERYWVSAGIMQGPDFLQNRRIKKLRKNPNYRKNKRDDIAILKLDSPLILNNVDVGSACLPNGTRYDETIGVSGGFGRLSDGYPTFMAEPMIGANTCKSENPHLTEAIYYKEFCVGGKQDTIGHCNHDSGGPFIVPHYLYPLNDRAVLMGVMTAGWGEPCGKGRGRGYPDVFTAVGHYIPWIKSNMGENGYKYDGYYK